MIDLLGFSLCLFSFNCFALAKFNHFKGVFKKRPTEPQCKKLLLAAWISILLSLVLFVATQGGYGALLFCGFMSLSVLIIMIFYNFLISYVKILSIINIAIIALTGLFVGLN
ncbi:DUF3325 domain-containing protein [Pseudoalteromonas sp. SWXJZ94C]|uniref:DUF3325 domain-containing protein n=1 Tax=unclassified Pseudoalteromonas TaxID=194690 RepID=UPI000403D6CF|nr:MULTISPECIES: DUF3325 domain-containing protein [unclassified Pseudoalteromonas]MBH0059371.1 DUF3325 domain-containing protein [Pseudoalteromonas sp. SWXJZ94C]